MGLDGKRCHPCEVYVIHGLLVCAAMIPSEWSVTRKQSLDRRFELGVIVPLKTRFWETTTRYRVNLPITRL